MQNRHKLSRRIIRRALSRVEVVLAIVGVLLVGSLAGPMLSRMRETSRQAVCRGRIHDLSRGLSDFHAAHNRFPTAANWSVTATESIQLNASKQIARITLDNWAIQLLPFVGRDDLAKHSRSQLAIGADDHQALRTTQLDAMTCPSDTWNREDNPYRFRVSAESTPTEFARGNYGICGGSQRGLTEPPSTQSASGEEAQFNISEDPRTYELSGNGVAGINKSFSLDEFTNGQSTLIALEELRAGVHPLDPRGAWALGQIGGSITWANGVLGDAGQPNSQFFRSDDVLGCRELHAAYGSDRLAADGMPCCVYIDANGQAGARSLHPGGVFVAFVDASTRFISDKVDLGLWHVLHSRKTPPEILAEDLEARLQVENFPDSPPLRQVAPSTAEVNSHLLPESITNSIGMNLVSIAAGEFTMGVPDVNNDVTPPTECPAHPVRITRDFLIGTCEVTEAQFRAVMKDDRSRESRSGPGATTSDSGAFVATEIAERRERWPMTNVTWDEAEAFCNRLSEIPAEVAAGRRYRLPTEAEWEFACRNRTSKPYHWGKKRERGDDSGEAAGIEPALPLAHIASYSPNDIGLYDMRGNAWEWTADWFDRDYYARSRVDDPQGPVHGYLKVVRGSDWRFIGDTCHHDSVMMPPWQSNSYVGFRVVCDVVNESRAESNDGGR